MMSRYGNAMSLFLSLLASASNRSRKVATSPKKFNPYELILALNTAAHSSEVLVIGVMTAEVAASSIETVRRLYYRAQELTAA
ncbi:hypothetical protein, partial [Haematobacter massiliensis]